MDKTREEIEQEKEKAHTQAHGIHYAGDFDGADSLNMCDICNEPRMMSELTVIHRGGEADEFMCGMCAMNRLSSGLLKQ